MLPESSTVRSTLVRQDIQGLTRQCCQAPTGVRNRALIVTLYRAGLRLGEALTLAPDRIDFIQHQIAIVGRHSRLLPLDQGASREIVRWMNVRDKIDLGNTGMLFCTLKGRPIQPDYVRQLLPRLAEKAGIPKRVHAQALRDAYAGELVVAGVPLAEIRQLLGFDTGRSLARYLSQIGPYWESAPGRQAF